MNNLNMTYHFDLRMNKRGITKSMVDLTLKFGEIKGDKYVTNRKNLKKFIQDLDNELRLISRLRQQALKLIDKGGIAVVIDKGSLITTYNTNSYFHY